MKTDNELIAEFMGFKKVGNVMEKWEDGYTSVLCCDIKDLKSYEGYWDWLMPVVEKIEGLGGIRFMIEKNRVMIVWAEHEYFWNSGTTAQTKIQTTHDAVSEFIKWYNQQKP
jgi:hypothetical protein